MFCTTTSDTAAVWAKAVQTLPLNTMKFALNAAHDTLPNNVNLQLWKKKDKAACPLCGKRQSLLHVLNNCKVARDLRYYNQGYDAVLKRLFNLSDQTEFSPTTQLTTDLSDGYEFLVHIVSTDLHPDMVCPAEISHACRIDSKL